MSTTDAHGCEVPTTDPGFGRIYGCAEPAYITHEGVPVWMWRKGQRVRFYDAHGNQHGPEQGNVVPAVVYAGWAGWRDPTAPDWLNEGVRAEVRRNMTTRRATDV